MILLVGKNGKASCQSLAHSLINKGVEVTVIEKVYSQKGDYFRLNGKRIKTTGLVIEDEIIFRYGITSSEITLSNCIELNTIKGISLASNKKESRMALIDADIPTVPIMKEGSTFRESMFPLVARPNKHSQGKNFHLLNTLEELKGFVNTNGKTSHYYSPFIIKKAEYRLHVAGGKILNYLSKPLTSSPTANHGVDPFESVNWSDYNLDVCKAAVGAVKALGLNWGAVDVLVDNNNTALVLEVNTAPGIDSSEYTVERYSKYLSFVERTRNTEDFDTSKFEKAKSFAWKNEQLDGKSSRSSTPSTVSTSIVIAEPTISWDDI